MGILNGVSCGACGGTGKAHIGMPDSQPPEDRRRHEESLSGMAGRLERGPEPGEPAPAEPPFYLIVDRSIPPDEVHFRDQQSRTIAVMKLGDGHRLVLPRKANDTVPVSQHEIDRKSRALNAWGGRQM